MSLPKSGMDGGKNTHPAGYTVCGVYPNETKNLYVRWPEIIYTTTICECKVTYVYIFCFNIYFKG